MLKRNFPKIDKEDFTVLYKTYVRRPHMEIMEFCIQACSPCMVKDIQLLEKVQQRATKWVKGFENRSYSERLNLLLGLTTLEKRRKRGDLIEVFKIITGREDIESESLFTIANNVHHLQ